MRPALRLGSNPSSALTPAAAPFSRASHRTTARGTVSPEIGKFSTALAVSEPHSWPRLLTRGIIAYPTCPPRAGGRALLAPQRAWVRASRRSESPRGRALTAERDQLPRHADGI